MKSLTITIVGLVLAVNAFSQQKKHTNKFEQLWFELRSPNDYRSASGAPGPFYWQNTADYDIAITLDDEKASITGEETITYTNNSPDPLSYLWLQLDQNVRAKDSESYEIQTSEVNEVMSKQNLKKISSPDFDGGFKIGEVTDEKGNKLSYIINKTMMRIDLPERLNTTQSFSFKVKWSYNINDRMELGGRSGYEYFAKDDNRLYTIAQFFPRMCVYNDYDGWQNKQFLGSGEFSLPFGDYKVKITVPEDHILGATGKLQNPREVLADEHIERLEKAMESFDKPVLIVTQKEAEKAEKKKRKGTKTWVFHADNVRDFAFATSRKFIWDAMAVKIGDRRVMAMSYYPKEGNPLWEEYSTRVVAHTLRVYSKHTIDYPYHKAISVHTARIGMEYPMICFNYGRPNEDGTYSDKVKYGMAGVIIHEVGHNFFPMIINSDERQWTWMDEGLNTFTEFLAEEAFEEEFGEKFPARRGPAHKIIPYMSMDKKLLSPIMTNSEQVQNLGPNAYGKPATALNILREVVMGRELFDYAFKEYSQRWAFKHPTPSDFFRTMEDASAVDLDWFWRGWFYTVDHVDVSLGKVRVFKMEEGLPKTMDENFSDESNDPQDVKQFYTTSGEEREDMNYYELTFENIGGLLTPILFEFEYEDGTKEKVKLPAEIWTRNDEMVVKTFAREKKVKRVVLDPEMLTADTNIANNFWPRQEMPSRFEKFYRNN